jgi:predicted ATPase/class 3 adenylate cyclase
MAELPTGTVTFLFTDLEGSTRLWEECPEEMKTALGRHDCILHGAVERHHGIVFSRMGDGIAAVFGSAADALGAVLDARGQLCAETWGTTGPLRVRMGVHTDEGRMRAPGEYANPPLNRCARLMAVAHGGQALLSDAAATLVRGALPRDVVLVDLGEHRLRDLADRMRVFQLMQPGVPGEFPPLRSLDVLPGNLPRQLTTFVGRAEELATLTRLLRDRSLVTLTGVGGVGKTRLAVQAAAEVLPDFPDGAWLCELAPVSDPDALWEALAASLGVKPSPGRSADDVILDYLALKRMLVVLDNCEHLLNAVAHVVDLIAKRCADVTVLATSREGLAVTGEQIVAVPSLDIPAAGAALDALSRTESVGLFVDRAHDAKSTFDLTDQNADAVAQLCRRLDGIPLAIELAAARVRSLSPEDLVNRLDQRFKLLTRGSRAALERHQTLRSTIDWSYDLLSPTERAALNQLSVFAGSCDLVAAEAVPQGELLAAPDVADVLSQLVDKSLVAVDESNARTRYRLLETIRQYAQERLEASDDAPAARRRHADHYVAVAEAAGPELRGRDQIARAAAAARETDNFRVVLDWALEESSTDHALRMIAPLAVNGVAIGYTAMDWAEAACALPGAAHHHLFPIVASWAAWGATMHGDLALAEELVEMSLAAEDELGTRMSAACQGVATLAFFRGDLQHAKQHADEWVARARVDGDPYELAHASIMQASALQVDDVEASVRILEEAVHIARDAGIASALAIGLSTLGAILASSAFDSTELERSQRACERALRSLDEAIEIGNKVGDRQSVASASLTRASIAFRRREWRAALQASADAAQLQLELGVGAMGSTPLAAAAVALIELGHLEPAAVLLGAADSRTERFGPHWWIELLVRSDAALVGGLGAEVTAVRAAQGAAMEPVDAVDYLRVESARVLGDD